MRTRDCIKDFEWQICLEDLEEEEDCNTDPCSSKFAMVFNYQCF